MLDRALTRPACEVPLHLKLLLATIFWGATPTIGRTLASYEAPLAIVCGRFLVAALFLLWFTAAARQFVAVPRRLWWRFAVLGVSGIVLHNGLMFKGLEYTSATTASIILALVSIQVVILDLVLYRRRPDRLAAVGVVLAFAGTVFVITSGQITALFEIGFGYGELLIFGSGLAWALYSVVGREVLEVMPALAVTTYSTLIGLVFLIPFLFEQPAVTLALYSDVNAVAMIFFLGIVGSALGFLWYYQGVVAIGTLGTSIYVNLVPVFGVLSAAVFLGEALDQAVLGGGALVLGGVLLVNRPFARRSQAPPPVAVALDETRD